MNTNKIIYWVSTAILGGMMLFSAYSYFTNPQMTQAFQHLGFPDYFRIELGIAKIFGALALLIPQTPGKIKEWAYAGFAITFISAGIGHFNSDDPVSAIIMPLIFLLILTVSYFFYLKPKTV